MHKILMILPITNDHLEMEKLDSSQYEVHYLHASDDVVDTKMATFAYGRYLSQPGFLNSYVDRAVEYVKENGIEGIIFGHDLSSVVASVVCDITGLRGPSLESTFRSLHKYYARVTAKGNIWFDYIHLDEPSKSWKEKIHFPCFIKAPFLTACKGNACIKNEEEMEASLAELRKLTRPYFIGYSEFFKKHLDLGKFPLAVENIVLVEELVELADQYCAEGWVDEAGNFNLFTIGYEFVCAKRKEFLNGWVIPQYDLEKKAYDKLVKVTEEMGRRFGLRNTFFDIEIWKQGDEFTLVEVNARITSMISAVYTKMWGVSLYEAAVSLACGNTEKLKKTRSSASYKDGELISGLFYVYTTGEGKAKEFLNFDYAREGCISDGVYNNGGPGALMCVDEDSAINQVSSSANLCYFFITDHNYVNLFKRAKEIVSKLAVRKEDGDLFVVPI